MSHMYISWLIITQTCILEKSYHPHALFKFTGYILQIDHHIYT